MVAMQRQTRCIACNGETWIPVRQGFDQYRPEAGSFVLSRCRDCGHISQIPQPSEEQLSLAYAISYNCYQPAWRQQRWHVWKMLRELTTARRMSRLRRYAKLGALLEVGSGAGDFLNAASRAGWNVCGVEYDKASAELLQEELGLDVRQGELRRGMWPAGSFDVVAMWNVLEHVPHPLETVEISAEYVKPGGVVLIQVPTIYSATGGQRFGEYWHLLDLPRHLNFFSRDSLTRICGAAGLKVIHTQTSAIDEVWCHLASTRDYVRSLRGSLHRPVALLGHTLLTAIEMPWMLVKARQGHGTEIFAVAKKQ